jgi:hypothetical protein
VFGRGVRDDDIEAIPDVAAVVVVVVVDVIGVVVETVVEAEAEAEALTDVDGVLLRADAVAEAVAVAIDDEAITGPVDDDATTGGVDVDDDGIDDDRPVAMATECDGVLTEPPL